MMIPILQMKKMIREANNSFQLINKLEFKS